MNLRKSLLLGGGIAVGTGVACTGVFALAAKAALKKRAEKLRGKVVLITGASRGLGLALAEEFARRGAKLALTARNAEELERARLLLKRRKSLRNDEDILAISCDLRKREEAEKLIDQVATHFGRIDFLVNNAGVITVGPIENQTADDFQNVMESNFFSGLYCTLAVLPQMLARRSGNIVNIASIGDKVAVPHMLPYTASKFAVVGFSEGLHAELRAKGVRVTTVCPGLMRTGSHVNAFFKGDAEREYRWFSLGASLPGVSTSAQCAARQIVRAAIAGRSEIAITPQAKLAARFAQISPEITHAAMSAVSTVLPSPTSEKATLRRGIEVDGLALKPLTALGKMASRRYNQHG